MHLHSKVLELKNRVGSSPIHKSSPIRQSEAVREMNKEEANKNSRLLKQYFCLFGEEDDCKVTPMKGCFKKSIEERGPSTNAAQKITVLYAHNQHKPLCIPSIIKEDEIGLYAEYTPDEGVQHCDEAVIQIRSGTINGGSYGFNYIWDKMKYDEQTDTIKMYDCKLFELSPVVFGSQGSTFAVRNSLTGILEDEFLTQETEQILKHIPRDKQLEMRNIIDRHIALSKNQSLEIRRKALEEEKPQNEDLDFDKLINNF